MVAGRRSSNGYVLVSIGGEERQAHRVAWAIVHGEWPVEDIDHINRIKWDNRLTNLRQATKSENAANVPPCGSTSKFKGVSWHKKAGKWRAQIKVRGKKIHLGTFLCEPDAARAYDLAAARHFGSFAYLNFPSDGASSHA